MLIWSLQNADISYFSAWSLRKTLLKILLTRTVFLMKSSLLLGEVIFGKL